VGGVGVLRDYGAWGGVYILGRGSKCGGETLEHGESALLSLSALNEKGVVGYVVIRLNCVAARRARRIPKIAGGGRVN